MDDFAQAARFARRLREIEEKERRAREAQLMRALTEFAALGVVPIDHAVH